MTSKKRIMEVTPSIFVHSNILILTLANVCYVFPTKLEKNVDCDFPDFHCKTFGRSTSSPYKGS